MQPKQHRRTCRKKLASIFTTLVTVLVFASAAPALANSKVPRTVYGEELKVIPIAVSKLGVALTFPVKPKKVVLGKADSFGIEYVNSDLVISPLAHNVSSMLFVYLSGRRFSFKLQSAVRGDSVVRVKDALSQQIKVPGEK